MIEKIKLLYEHLYQISTGNPNFEFKPKERESKIIENFAARLTPSHGEDWLFTYFCFQFGKYANLKTRFGKGQVRVGWVLGPKAYDKYQSASDEEKYWGSNFRDRFNIRNPLLEGVSSEIKREVKDYKDRERNRFKSQIERQFLHCMELELFDEKNVICKFCKNKKECYE